jgi:hypothetical protein
MQEQYPETPLNSSPVINPFSTREKRFPKFLQMKENLTDYNCKAKKLLSKTESKSAKTNNI